MLNESADVFFVDCVENVPEIVSVWKPSFRQFIGKVEHEVGLLFSEWVHVLDG